MTNIVRGQLAPPIRLPDVGGKTVSLADGLKKGPVVAAFFKISCPVCQFTFPFLERIHKAYDQQRVSVLGISQDDAADTKEFLREYGCTFPSLVDDRGYPASNAYGLTNVPTVLLIAPDGKVRVSSTGFDKKDLESISREIARYLSVPPVAVFKRGESVPDYKPG